MNKFKITIDENNFDVTVNVTDHNRATVEVNGISYDVSYESKNIVPPTVTRKAAAIPAATQYHATTQSNAPANKSASIKAPLPGTISAINVKVGSQVKRGDVLIVMEAMKMENNIMANSDGQVKTIHVTTGQSVSQDDPLIELA
ncbi:MULTISPECIES: biotin/lipoyl-containing protein [Odoribacteraceae]|uniref:biotin/lipoyl-containing protein n=1 Tax=Odoribacteraceae TaxID=1853231 RepID=UPI000E496E5C|nr:MULTISPECIES: acetyl-CoA carboxylase biotin carboxyl carrier protein subunit [Odoribacteraceae]MCQ4873252.1 biotin/lipoyl-binding protein [Butyricimonas paravirosa]RHR78994.1 acetyl-CoA carboxylase biotin carboxyl carrier protein subunit [Odoribacter sp. AF15-53]